MQNDIERVILTQDEIEAMCKTLGEKITKDYAGKKIVCIGLLKGCQPFMSDVMKHINLYADVDYMKVTSYEGVKSTGTIIIKTDINVNIEGKDVLIIDDIVDTGKTTKYIKELLLDRKAKSVEICVLLDKPEGRLVDIHAKYIGGIVPNEFVVGYGLDYNGAYRNLPYIGVLKSEMYK